MIGLIIAVVGVALTVGAIALFFFFDPLRPDGSE
jgi:hypothetical protein